jgi:predicted metal-binding protein
MNSEQPNLKALEAVFQHHDCADFRWIDPQIIVVAQWVRMKCMFGCGDYGQNAACPPNVPPVSDCERFFREYTQAVIFHFEKKLDNPDDRHKWTKQISTQLLDIERAVFLAGYQKAFLLFPDNCHICGKCPGKREECKHPKQSRPTPEALGMDVYATVRAAGYPIQVLADYAQAMNRYAFLLVE